MDKVYGSVNPKLLTGLTDEQRNAILNWESYQQFQRGMSDVIWQMKEIPVLPSEIPPEDDKFSLQRVELPAQGGVLTYMDRLNYPYKGFPYQEFVEKIDMMKKVVKGSMSGFYHSFKTNPLKLLSVIFSVKDLIYIGTYTFHRLVERYKIKSFRYSTAIRELHRAFSYPRGENPKMMELRLMIRDVLCMILEFDNAYRFRAQDLLPEINKDSLRKNPIRELNRLADIAIGREKEQQVKDTWKLIKMFNSLYLRFDRQLKTMVVDVLSELNSEQFKLTPEDKQFCTPRKDYVFGYTQCH